MALDVRVHQICYCNVWLQLRVFSHLHIFSPVEFDSGVFVW